MSAAALTIAPPSIPNSTSNLMSTALTNSRTRRRPVSRTLATPPRPSPLLNHALFERPGCEAIAKIITIPRNSFLNDVLDRGLGIPITLALIYMEVGRRLGFPLFGVGMPGHFLLKHYDIDGRETAGRLLQRWGYPQPCRIASGDLTRSIPAR